MALRDGVEDDAAAGLDDDLMQGGFNNMVSRDAGSRSTWGNRALTAAASTAKTCGCRLSSMTTSAPAPAAASASAAQLHSTSILTLKPHRARAAVTAAGMLPVAAMWLSFSMTCAPRHAMAACWSRQTLTMELRSMRCVSTLPIKSPYLQQ